MKLKYRVIERFRGRYTVEEMCRVFQVSRSGYYAWRARQNEAPKDQWLIDLVIECQQKCSIAEFTQRALGDREDGTLLLNGHIGAGKQGVRTVLVEDVDDAGERMRIDGIAAAWQQNTDDAGVSAAKTAEEGIRAVIGALAHSKT